MSLFPVFQLRHDSFHMRHTCSSGHSSVHMLCTKIDQLFLTSIFELPVRIAPFTVLFIKIAIRLFADRRILQRHPAALADQLSRHSQKRVDRNIKHPRQQLECFRIGHGLPIFPARHRLSGHHHLFRKIVLRHSAVCAELQNNILRFHRSFLHKDMVHQLFFSRKQLAVALFLYSASRGQTRLHSRHKMHSVPFFRRRDGSSISTSIGQTFRHLPQEMHLLSSHFTRISAK